MTEEEYNHMVDMLIRATKAGKLNWNDDEGRFFAVINECSILIYPDYDTIMDASSYSLALKNPAGVIFHTYSFDERSGKSGYILLSQLYAAIKDSVYQITESERKILDGLEELTGKK